MDLQIIDQQINEILNGTRDLSGFNQQEHAGICTASPSLIGALIVCNRTRESLAAGCNAAAGQGTIPNWQIDQAQEAAVQQWAEARVIWKPDADNWLGHLAHIFLNTKSTKFTKSAFGTSNGSTRSPKLTQKGEMKI